MVIKLITTKKQLQQNLRINLRTNRITHRSNRRWIFA